MSVSISEVVLIKKIMGCLEKAVENYKMIEEGDVIGVGLSGGKDSIVLLHSLKLYQNFSPVQYDIKAFSLTMGFDDFDLSPVSDYCHAHGIEHIIEETEIGKVVFEERNDKHPCGMCSRMKRARLNKVCASHGVLKLALGHHGDDAIESLLMSMFFEGRIRTFKPVSFMDRSSITVIRPLIYALESDISKAFIDSNLPVVKNPCPVDKKTKREFLKNVLNNLSADIPHIKKNLLCALENKEQLEIWK